MLPRLKARASEDHWKWVLSAIADCARGDVMGDAQQHLDDSLRRGRKSWLRAAHGPGGESSTPSQAIMLKLSPEGEGFNPPKRGQ